MWIWMTTYWTWCLPWSQQQLTRLSLRSAQATVASDILMCAGQPEDAFDPASLAFSGAWQPCQGASFLTCGRCVPLLNVQHMQVEASVAEEEDDDVTRATDSDMPAPGSQGGEEVSKSMSKPVDPGVLNLPDRFSIVTRC